MSLLLLLLGSSTFSPVTRSWIIDLREKNMAAVKSWPIRGTRDHRLYIGKLLDELLLFHGLIKDGSIFKNGIRNRAMFHP